ncbi:MAG: hypothetical protein ACK4GK_06175 [Ferrovibrio sp.]|jgi:glycosyltransferase involved in cell wall biosynthesis
MIRISFTYHPSDAPGGGANNFLRGLKTYLAAKPDFILNGSGREPFDILFMNELNQGPNGGVSRLRLSEITDRIRTSRQAGHKAKLVVRAVNQRRQQEGLSWRDYLSAWLADRAVLKLLDLADFVIFQSNYQRGFFHDYGFTNPLNRVIVNGAAPEFLSIPRRAYHPGETLRLVSATASARTSKRHEIIAGISLLPGVEVQHFGRWPDGLPTGAVRLAGITTHQQMAVAYRKAHAFLHPAHKDPCPNALLEGLSSGLPALYGDGPGSGAELTGACGLPIDMNGLEATIEALRNQHEALTARLEARRPYYSISRAAEEYIDVFRKLAAT